jgi:hypothetical protein
MVSCWLYAPQMQDLESRLQALALSDAQTRVQTAIATREAELTTVHAHAMREQRVVLETTADTAVKALIASHNDEVQELQSQLVYTEQQHVTQLEQLQVEFDNNMKAALDNQSDAFKQQLDEAVADARAQVREDCLQEYERAQRDTATAHASALNELKQVIMAQHEAALSAHASQSAGENTHVVCCC